MGGCCVGDFIFRAIDAVGDFISDLFCSDSGCGYHPSQSKTDAHAKKIADELAIMKENIRESTEKTEEILMDYINKSMNDFLDELESINRKKYGGKSLNINISGIKEENENLKKNVTGHIGDIMNDRLVLTDNELSIILEERDDEKRAKNFDNFCTKVKKEAVESLKLKIEDTVKKQSEMTRKEVQTRLNEVDKSMKEVQKAYTEILDSKKQGGIQMEETQMKYIYKYALCDLLLDQIGR